jgi:nucleotide-binding universal stress UspA family protein
VSNGTGAVVVGFDERSASLAALAMAAHIAGRLTVELHVVHVITERDYPIDPDAADWDEHAEALQRRLLDQVATNLAGHMGDWEYHTRRGSTAHHLVAVADAVDAMLIVIGTYRRSGLDRVRRGSVLRKLSRRSNRAILLVPETQDPGRGTG